MEVDDPAAAEDADAAAVEDDADPWIGVFGLIGLDLPL